MFLTKQTHLYGCLRGGGERSGWGLVRGGGCGGGWAVGSDGGGGGPMAAVKEVLGGGGMMGMMMMRRSIVGRQASVANLNKNIDADDLLVSGDLSTPGNPNTKHEKEDFVLSTKLESRCHAPSVAEDAEAHTSMEMKGGSELCVATLEKMEMRLARSIEIVDESLKRACKVAKVAFYANHAMKIVINLNMEKGEITRLLYDEETMGKSASIAARLIYPASYQLSPLKNGGRMIYCEPMGRNSSSIIEYFEIIYGSPKIKDNNYPPTWMLEASSTFGESVIGVDFSQIYYALALYKLMTDFAYIWRLAYFQSEYRSQDFDSIKKSLPKKDKNGRTRRRWKLSHLQKQSAEKFKRSSKTQKEDNVEEAANEINFMRKMTIDLICKFMGCFNIWFWRGFLVIFLVK
ncbi:hypothetical protein Tco_0532034 [Tanacetum coccineum]